MLLSGPGGHDSDRRKEPVEVPHRRQRVEQPEVVHPTDEGGGQQDEDQSRFVREDQPRKPKILGRKTFKIT